MATVFMLNLPSSGHITPCLGIAQELVARGERVWFPAPARFRQAIEGTGAQFVPFGHEIPSGHTSLVGGALWRMRTARRCMPELADAIAAARADYLIVDYTCIWGFMLGQHFGLPVIVVYGTAPGAFSEVRQMRPAEATACDLRAHPAKWPHLLLYRCLARSLARRWDVEYIHHPLHAVLPPHGDLYIATTSRQLEPPHVPPDPGFQFFGPCMRQPDRGRLEALAASGRRPLIYVSLGTYWNRRPEFFRNCIRAFAGDAYEVIIVIGSDVKAHTLGPLPPNIQLRTSVDQVRVLEHAALFVSHGGINSLGESILAGVPLLLCPQGMDQFYLARRVRDLGAGVVVPRGEATPEVLLRLAQQVLADSGIASRLRQLGEAMRREGGASAAADVILDFARRNAPDAITTRRRSARLLNIVGHQRVTGSITTVSSRDFALEDAGGVDPQLVLKRQNVSLYCLDLRRGRALFVEGDGRDLLSAPFFYQAQAAAARRLIAVPIELLPQLAEQVSIDESRLAFIYSTGRCGSTLVSRAFHAVPGAVSLSEPDIYTQLVCQRITGSLSGAQLRQLLRACVLLQCAPYCRQGNPTVLAFKFRSFVIELGDLLQDLFPQAKAVFIYRNAVEYFRSAALLLGPTFIGRLSEPSIPLHNWYRGHVSCVGRGHSREGRPLTPAGLLACAWASCMEGALNLQKNAVRLLPFRYEELSLDPHWVLQQLFRFCGLASSGDLTSILARDSQAGTDISRERLAVAAGYISASDVDAMLDTLARSSGVAADERIPGTLTLPCDRASTSAERPQRPESATDRSPGASLECST